MTRPQYDPTGASATAPLGFRYDLEARIEQIASQANGHALALDHCVNADGSGAAKARSRHRSPTLTPLAASR